MEAIFNNLINGNLREALVGAKKYSEKKLEKYAYDNLGYSNPTASISAGYLKGRFSFEYFCKHSKMNVEDRILPSNYYHNCA